MHTSPSVYMLTKLILFRDYKSPKIAARPEGLNEQSERTVEVLEKTRIPSPFIGEGRVRSEEHALLPQETPS